MTIKVCVGSSCHLKGSYNVIEAFKEILKKYDVEDVVELQASFCLGHCSRGVTVLCDGMEPASHGSQVEETPEGFILHGVNAEYLEFKTVQCKDCYRCVRECPVKAIEVKSHHAQIIEEHCILCGHCTHVCPQNAKIVHSELPVVRQLLASGQKVAATVAPSFINNLSLKDFSTLRIALSKLGFSIAE